MSGEKKTECKKMEGMNLFLYCLLFWGKKYGKFVLSKTAGISPYLMPSENLVVPKASFSGAKSTACNLKIISL